MKLLYGFFLFFLATTFAEEIPEFLQYKEGQRYFLYPTEDGKFQVVDLLAVDTTNRFDPDTDVIYYLFTRSNPTNGQRLIIGNQGSLDNSNFDRSKPVKVVSHGWNSDSRSEACTLVRNNFLNNMDVNVICVDWGAGSSALYPTAAVYVAGVGRNVAALIDWLVGQGAAISRFHIMGHSLGGHIVGHAGRNVRTGQIPYITAFDPALPLWGADSGRIRPSDGGYVEVIHTNGGNLGLEDPVGHNDFYPNGGKNMPGCTVINVGCSHGRSYEYFAYSIDHSQFMANQCRGYWEEISIGFCSNLSRLHMGGASTKQARGTFYLQTGPNPPFYLG